MAIRILHVGDVHLGVELYGRPEPQRGYNSRVADFLLCLDAALEHAQEADVVLFAGDLYKNSDPNQTVQREFARRICRLSRQTPVVIIPGNHDVPNTMGRANAVDIFSALEVPDVTVIRDPALKTIETKAGPLLVAALPFVPRSRLLAQEETRGKDIAEIQELVRLRMAESIEGMAADAEEARKELGAETPAVLLGHLNVQGATWGGYSRPSLLPEVQLPASVLRNPVFDYVALAHIHKWQRIGMPDLQPPVVYAGSIERVDFGEEDEEKVVVMVTLERGRAIYNPVKLPARRFLTIRVNADPEEPLPSVLAAVEAKAEDLPGSVVRLIYTLPPGQPHLPDRELRAALKDAYCVAGVRREMPKLDPREQQNVLTPQLTPIEALRHYIRANPQLKEREDELVKYAEQLVTQGMLAAEVSAA